MASRGACARGLYGRLKDERRLNNLKQRPVVNYRWAGLARASEAEGRPAARQPVRTHCRGHPPALTLVLP